jgi:phosphatidylserine/phosphatidylglycerophosphate/cardiolipin synthase-like enzyme
MYHTPNLTGLRKKIIPKRINEGWGLQHMKLYGIDDEIIISGYEIPVAALTTEIELDILGNLQSEFVE